MAREKVDGGTDEESTFADRSVNINAKSHLGACLAGWGKRLTALDSRRGSEEGVAAGPILRSSLRHPSSSPLSPSREVSIVRCPAAVQCVKTL